MKLNEPINIMLTCCIPDKRRLLEEIGKLSAGDVLRIEIDDCVSSRAMVESYLKNKWCRIVQTEEKDGTSILHIRLEVTHDSQPPDGRHDC